MAYGQDGSMLKYQTINSFTQLLSGTSSDDLKMEGFF
jgi:hypothetical protein